jgi:hypothetical protein
LVASALAGRLRFPATATALCYTLLFGAAVWILPLIPGEPQGGPIYHPRTHLLPPPFPLLLLAPAFVLDLLLRAFPGRGKGRGRAVEAGLAFFFVFAAVQWPFAGFLLSPSADHWFFAGGGKQWPCSQWISPSMRTAFWPVPGDEFTTMSVLTAAALAIVAAGAGCWMGARLNRS